MPGLCMSSTVSRDTENAIFIFSNERMDLNEDQTDLMSRLERRPHSQYSGQISISQQRHVFFGVFSGFLNN